MEKTTRAFPSPFQNKLPTNPADEKVNIFFN